MALTLLRKKYAKVMMVSVQANSACRTTMRMANAWPMKLVLIWSNVARPTIIQGW